RAVEAVLAGDELGLSQHRVHRLAYGWAGLPDLRFDPLCGHLSKLRMWADDKQPRLGLVPRALERFRRIALNFRHDLRRGPGLRPPRLPGSVAAAHDALRLREAGRAGRTVRVSRVRPRTLAADEDQLRGQRGGGPRGLSGFSSAPPALPLRRLRRHLPINGEEPLPNRGA